MNLDLPQTPHRQADLIRFVQLARSTESHFETARFNHSRTSPNLHSTPVGPIEHPLRTIKRGSGQSDHRP